MRHNLKLLPGFLLVLALVAVTGICAADDNTTVTSTETITATVTATPTETVTETVTTTATQTTVADNPDDDTDDETGDGSFGPGNPLYGLKIGLENLDETFTFNETDKLNKQMNHARLRLSEVRYELSLNNTVTADEALALYQDKLNATQMYLDMIANASDSTGVLHAQEMVVKHQMVLENLMLANPNSTGLARAYNNSLALELKFENKTENRIERIVEKNNNTVLKAVRLNVKVQERTENKNEEKNVGVQQQEKVQNGGNGNSNDNSNGYSNDNSNGNSNKTTTIGNGNGNKNVQDTPDTGNQNDNRNNNANTNTNGKGKNR